MGYNLLINVVYWDYNPLTNHLLTSWDILEVVAGNILRSSFLTVTVFHLQHMTL